MVLNSAVNRAGQEGDREHDGERGQEQAQFAL
jgi:hypothetical protein